MNAVDYFSNKYSGIAPKNSNLTKAKAAKNDEFYTQYSDIEAELSHYEVKYFADRVVYLPCDDWHFSQFVKYFENNFTRLQLKALVATGINFSGAGYYYKKTSEGVITGVLEGNGDFRSDACRQLMREADIIVTNPPFSLFREFVAQIMEFRKKFLIIGNQNAITYRDIFDLERRNLIWLGYEPCKAKTFEIPADMYDSSNKSQSKNGSSCYQTLGNICWFTNIDHNRRHEHIEFNSNNTYSPEKYPKYDNYDAIDVSKLSELPHDYFGIMGVPITYFAKHCPDQFEIIFDADGNTAKNLPDDVARLVGYKPGIKDKGGAPLVNGKLLYKRLLIKRKTIPVEAE